MGRIVDRAIADSERGLGGLHVRLEDDAREPRSSGSPTATRGRRSTRSNSRPSRRPSATACATYRTELVTEAMQRRGSIYDKGGEAHYDTISAFIKSVRASDPDAAVYWLARMIDGGEDPLFIARRLVILASEDVGLRRLARTPGGDRGAASGAFHRNAGRFLSARARDAVSRDARPRAIASGVRTAPPSKTCSTAATIPCRCICATHQPVSCAVWGTVRTITTRTTTTRSCRSICRKTLASAATTCRAKWATKRALQTG